MRFRTTIAALLFWLGLVAPAWAAIGTPTDLGHFAGSSTPTSGTITTLAAVSSGDMIVLIRYTNASTGTFTSAPTDTAGNTYVQAPSSQRVTSTSPVADIWYVVNATAEASSSTISFNFSGSSLREGVTAFKVSGMKTTSPIDLAGGSTTVNGTTGTSTGATSLNVRSMYNSELIVGMVTDGSSLASFVPGGSWTAVGGSINNGANVIPAYQILTTTPTLTAWAPTWVTNGLYRSFAIGFIGSTGVFQGGGGGLTTLGVSG